MKILVTGASGYIGSHLCKLLYDNGFHVQHYDIARSVNTDKLVHMVEFIDKYDKEYDVIVHLGGYISVAESVENPWKYYKNNIVNTMELLSLTKCNHFIFASTAGAFDPRSPYAYSKIVCEDLIRQMCKNYSIFRFFNVSGSDGTFQQINEATHLIRVAAEVAAGKRDKLVVYGTDYETYDGTCVRDYIHVLDLCEAILQSIKYPANTDYECLGSGTGYSVLDVIQSMECVTGRVLEVEYGDRRPGDPDVLLVNKMSEYMTATRTLEDMCRSTYEINMAS